MNLLSALPELKRKETLPGKHCICSAHGECECGCGADWTDYSTWNQAISELEKYQLCEESLAKVIEKYYEIDKWGYFKAMSEYLIDNSHLWIKRKDVKK